MHETIKSRLNQGNACYHFVLLSKTVTIDIHNIVVLYGCETWSLALTLHNVSN